jgi:ketosteroid isomerase-like protein
VPFSPMTPRRQAGIAAARFLMQWTAAISASIVGGAALAESPSDAAAVAEVTQLESKLEQVYNSPQFAKDPRVALVYFDNQAIRMFDVMQPVEFRGEAFRKHFIEVGTQFTGGKVAYSQLEVTADGNLAFATSIQRFSGTGKDGKPYDMTLRVTDCLRKTGGRWLIVHEHASIPLDAPTFMSVIAPKP